MKPYTYLIRWTKLNISYYGVRYAQDCDPSDLWNPYKTSSDIVKEFLALNGEPDIIQVRKTFTDPMVARLWENRVLNKMKVVGNDRWLNKHARMSPPINPLGNLAMRRPELRAKASKNNAGAGNPMFGKKQERVVCEHCNKDVSANTYALWHGDRCEIVNPQYRASVNLSRSGKNNKLFGTTQKKVPCDHCGKQVSKMNYKKWHGDFCLTNPNAKPRKQLPTKVCQHCGITIDIGNYTKLHGDKCKMNLARLVANTDLDVYND